MSEYRAEFNQGWREAKWTFWKVFWWVIGVIIVASIVSMVVFKPFAIANRITNPDRMIYTYEQFHNIYQDYLAAGDQIVNAQTALNTYTSNLPASREEWTYNDRQELNRLNTVVLGLQNHRRSLASEYNAMANQATRNFLQGRTLPERLSEN